jgi:hypothetical protein
MCPLYQYTVLTASFVAEKNPLAGAVPAPLARSAGHASIRSRGRTKRRPCPAWAGGGPASGSKIFFRNPGARPVRLVTTAASSRKTSATARFRLLRNACLFPAYIFSLVSALPRTPMGCPGASCAGGVSRTDAACRPVAGQREGQGGAVAVSLASGEPGARGGGDGGGRARLRCRRDSLRLHPVSGQRPLLLRRLPGAVRAGGGGGTHAVAGGGAGGRALAGGVAGVAAAQHHRGGGGGARRRRRRRGPG